MVSATTQLISVSIHYYLTILASIISHLTVLRQFNTLVVLLY